MSMSQAILTGLKVVEVSRYMSAAFCGMQLAEAGAQVTRIATPGEDPSASDPGFAVWRRSKDVLPLDLAAAGACEKLDELLASADVLIHDLGPKAAKALG